MDVWIRFLTPPLHNKFLTPCSRFRKVANILSGKHDSWPRDCRGMRNLPLNTYATDFCSHDKQTGAHYHRSSALCIIGAVPDLFQASTGCNPVWSRPPFGKAARVRQAGFLLPGFDDEASGMEAWQSLACILLRLTQRMELHGTATPHSFWFQKSTNIQVTLSCVSSPHRSIQKLGRQNLPRQRHAARTWSMCNRHPEKVPPSAGRWMRRQRPAP